MLTGRLLPPHYVSFGFRRKPSLLASASSDGVISIASQLPPWIQDEAERYWGYDATHVGILSDASALERYNALLRSVADQFLNKSASTSLSSSKY